MSKFKIRYATQSSPLAHVEAQGLSYSGGDGCVVAVFHGTREGESAESVVAICALQPGMLVERV